MGRWGGARGPATAPDRAPDEKLRARTRQDQALLYRLSGDRNPLHSDPVVATAAGFPRPILHGLCTYGIAGRVLLAHYGGSDPARYAALSGRLSRPVLPGDGLTVLTWEDGDRVDFVVQGEGDAVVIDRGCLLLREPRP